MKALEAIINARHDLTLDFFGGWLNSDIALLEKYRFKNERVPESGQILDWLGIRTKVEHHAWLLVPDNGIINIESLPIPSDMIHAEAIEYIALLISLERAQDTNRQNFVVVELGASYGPWATAAGVLALRLGFSQITVKAIEASASTVPEIVEHARINGLTDRPDVNISAVHAAVHIHDEDVFFPKIAVSSDNGAQISTTDKTTDYRGLSLDHEKVPGVSLRTICQELDQIDFMHLDLQGAEENLLLDEDFLSSLTAKVSTFFLATQSRFIEGLALRRLSALGWVLVRERPTEYQFNTRTKDINGWTLRDGGQLWLNPAFGETFLQI